MPQTGRSQSDAAAQHPSKGTFSLPRRATSCTTATPAGVTCRGVVGERTMQAWRHRCMQCSGSPSRSEIQHFHFLDTLRGRPPSGSSLAASRGGGGVYTDPSPPGGWKCLKLHQALASPKLFHPRLVATNNTQAPTTPCWTFWPEHFWTRTSRKLVKKKKRRHLP